MRDLIFISYRRSDRAALDELIRHLVTLPEDVRPAFWADTRIEPSELWSCEIEVSLKTAKAGVVLLSPAFFASTYIQEKELPALLAAAATDGVKIIPVLLETCDRQIPEALRRWLPGYDLRSRSEAEREAVWKKLVDGLLEILRGVSPEERIAAETVRLLQAIDHHPDLARLGDEIVQLQGAPGLDHLDRERRLVSLEQQRLTAMAKWLMEEIQKPSVSAPRREASRKKLEDVRDANARVQERAAELSRQEAEQILAIAKTPKKERASERPLTRRRKPCAIGS